MKKQPGIFGLILCGLLTAAAADSAAEYYVSPDGSNAASGRAGSPWKTFQHAAGKVAAGDTVRVAPGVYEEWVTVKTSGTAEAPIHFKSFKPHEAKVQGFRLEGSHITIEGFAITNDRKNGMGIDAGEGHRGNAAQGSKVIDNLIHDIEWTGVNLGENGLARGNVLRKVGRGMQVNSGSLVENNEIDTLVPIFESKNGKETIKKTQYFFLTGDNITFRGNYLHGTEEKYLMEPTMGVCFFSSYDTWIYPSSSNILIENNRCFNATHASEPTGSGRGESKNWIFRNNLFVNTVYVGIYLVKISNITIENNTFVNCGAYPVWFQSQPETVGSVVRNNIIAYHKRERVVRDFGWKPSESGIRNNLHDQFPVPSENNLFWGTLNREYGKTDFTADPLFVDPDNHDYRLRPGSPAIDAGTEIADIKTDLRGQPRPQGKTHDVGCYEFNPRGDAQ